MERVRGHAARATIALSLLFGAACASTSDTPPPNETMIVNMSARIDDAKRAAVDADLEALFAAQKEIF